MTTTNTRLEMAKQFNPTDGSLDYYLLNRSRQIQGLLANLRQQEFKN